MTFYRELAERAIKTFIQAAIAIWAASPVLDADVSAWKAVVVAGVAAALSVVSSGLSSQTGADGSPSAV